MFSKMFMFVIAVLMLQSVVVAQDVSVVEKWINAQADLKSLKANFTQERRLREGRRPIVSEGELEFVAPGSFRWQMGKPAVTLAVQKKNGDLTVVNVSKKEAMVYPFELLKEEEMARGFSFMDAGFPKTLEEFQKNFTLKETELKEGVYHVAASINDAKASIGLRKIVFYIDEKSFELRGFYLRFRDSSSITTYFSEVTENATIPSSSFELDLSGYKVETLQAKE